MSIAITGATGKFGSRVIKTLSTLVAPTSIVAITRDPSSEKAKALPTHVKVVRADFKEPTSLVEALKGVDIALIVSVDSIGPDAVALHKAAIDAAVQAKVRKVYYTSHQNSKKDSHFAAARDHWETEQYLESVAERGEIEFTSLRNGFYTSALKLNLTGVERTNKLLKPADGPMSWTYNDDMADAAAMLLAGNVKNSDDPVGKYVTLANTDSHDMEDVAKIMGKVTGKQVDRVVQDDQTFVDGTVKHGVPEPMAKMFLGMYHEAKSGGFVNSDDTLEKTLGRKPKTVEDFLKDEFAA